MQGASDLPFTRDGLVEAVASWVPAETPDQVWSRVLDRVPSLTPADRAMAMGGAPMHRPPVAHGYGFAIDGRRRVVAIQGGWWYRGVTAVEPHPDGTLVTYVVVNVARGLGKWAAHFVQARQHRKTIGGPPV